MLSRTIDLAAGLTLAALRLLLTAGLLALAIGAGRAALGL